MEGGLCFHANPDKAAELGRNGGRHRKQTYEQATEHIAAPESAADVRRMLAETMAEVKAGRMDPEGRKHRRLRWNCSAAGVCDGFGSQCGYASRHKCPSSIRGLMPQM